MSWSLVGLVLVSGVVLVVLLGRLLCWLGRWCYAGYHPPHATFVGVEAGSSEPKGETLMHTTDGPLPAPSVAPPPMVIYGICLFCGVALPIIFAQSLHRELAVSQRLYQQTMEQTKAQTDLWTQGIEQRRQLQHAITELRQTVVEQGQLLMEHERQTQQTVELLVPKEARTLRALQRRLEVMEGQLQSLRKATTP